MEEEIKFSDITEIAIQQTVPKRKFLFICSGKSEIVRFVGPQKKIFSYYDSSSRKIIFREFRDNNLKGLRPRIISLVIDRKDNNIKAYGCPITVFEQMAEYHINHDFQISRIGTGFQTIYNVKSLGVSEITKEQQNKVDFTLGAYSLEDIFIKNIKWEVLESKQEVEEDLGPIISRFNILDL